MEAVGEEYFVNIVTVVLTNIDFSDAFELAVEEKMIAEQTKLKADYENETKIAKAEAEAEAKIREAEAQIAIAEAQAEALLIAAEAEAEANRILDESLTDTIIRYTMASAWDGKLPVVTGDGDYILPDTLIN
jgi:regulator of protease activity HflC (stomatin/prohibitin superfamily)